MAQSAVLECSVNYLGMKEFKQSKTDVKGPYIHCSKSIKVKGVSAMSILGKKNLATYFGSW